jgi:hypothetical protein
VTVLKSKNFSLLIILIASIAFTCSLSEGEVLDEYNDLENEGWSIKVIENLVLNMTHGTNVWGHVFGIIKKQEWCDRNILYISWSSYINTVQQFLGEKLLLEIDVDSKSFRFAIEITEAFQALPEMTVLSFTNYSVDNEFIDLLERSNSVKVKIAGPDNIIKHFDILQESFRLEGFKENNQRIKEICQGKVQLARFQFN